MFLNYFYFLFLFLTPPKSKFEIKKNEDYDKMFPSDKTKEGKDFYIFN